MNNLYVLFCSTSNTTELRQFLVALVGSESLTELSLFRGKESYQYAVQFCAYAEDVSSEVAEKWEISISDCPFSNEIDLFTFEKPKLANQKIDQLFFDMDSTLIDMEVIVALAEHAGKAKEVSEITELAMNGELNFSESLIKRVATLKGLPKEVIEQVKTTLPLNIGAELLAEYMKLNEVKGHILSGGFSYFTEVLVKQLRFQDSRANALVIAENGDLTGEVAGDIVDAQAKADYVLGKTKAGEGSHMVVGDGANDLKMMATTPYSVAYKAKPVVVQQASFAINNTGLDAIIYLLRVINP